MAVSVNMQVPLPPLPPDAAQDGAKLAAWWESVRLALEQVLPVLAQDVNEMIGGKFAQLQFQVLAAAPKNPKTGYVAYADNTNWNPGAGEGLYEYRSDAAWHKL